MEKAESVDAYLAALPDDARNTLERIRTAIVAAAPKATVPDREATAHLAREEDGQGEGGRERGPPEGLRT